MEVTRIPPAYSEADQERRSRLMQKMAEIQRQAQEAARPIAAELAEIENRYAPRYIISGAEMRAPTNG